jgi:polyhydroxybutyrate depolymerase
MKNFSIVSSVILFLFFVPKSAYALHYGSIKVDGNDRAFYYYTPKNLSDNPQLLFVIHGSGMTPTGMQELTGYQFNKLADTLKDLVVVYPQAYERFWNDCRKVGKFPSRKLGIDDVVFFEDMITYFQKKFNINDSDVFATGYSNGGHMCFMLAKEKPELFKGFAVVSANLPVASNDNCEGTDRPVNILIMNGTTDPINPYNGGIVKAGDGITRGKVMSTDSTIAYWLKLDQCDSASKTEFTFPDLNKSDHSTVVEDAYTSAATGKKVVLLKVINGGHIFMNSGFHFWPHFLGNANKDINAPAVIMDFFHSLN